MDALIAGVVGGVLLAAHGPSGDEARGELPSRHARALLQRMADIEPFVGSREEKENRKAAVGRYFTADEYRRLRGNPVVGYWDLGTFHWQGGDRVAWAGMRNAHASCRGISAHAWDAAFAVVAHRQHLTVVRQAAVTLEGGCVAAVVDKSESEPVPGVLVEVRARGTGGETMVMRFAMGKPSVEDAMGAALELALTFSRSTRVEEPGDVGAR
jgi:hypothetical protein